MTEVKEQKSGLTKEKLMELEQKEKTPFEKGMDFVIAAMPLLCGLFAVWEYLTIPDIRKNGNPATYLYFLGFFILMYAVFLAAGLIGFYGHKKKRFQQMRYKAPLYSVLFLLLALYDYLTLKTGFLRYPFFPWVNDILNITFSDRAYLIESAVCTLKLLFCGYASGAVIGLVTGITCGYSERVRYWVDPVIKILGPIPTSTWIPIVMVIASTLFRGSVFIIGLGVWFSVTVASMTGISNVDVSYFEAARTLGASERQLVFRVAIPHAVPNIIQGMTQGMSTACTALMIAEMIGVEAGLGWYIIWAKAWAMYNKMYAALIIICLIFTAVTKILNMIKKRALRWQEGMVK